ncbi:hypothetical protein SPI_04966 [Niveomyces insectorum RCEF 264]|uniref:Uncharacterized protein n=1 Tax=Niveomyces insectorum RCEF 264 TaxID=1081102 RepID=A0A167TTY4_9HYPO|nr:hypothetical protein SPI_04966 [Niveomyces insectorum RCEF 264]
MDRHTDSAASYAKYEAMLVQRVHDPLVDLPSKGHRFVDKTGRACFDDKRYAYISQRRWTPQHPKVSAAIKTGSWTPQLERLYQDVPAHETVVLAGTPKKTAARDKPRLFRSSGKRLLSNSSTTTISISSESDLSDPTSNGSLTEGVEDTSDDTVPGPSSEPLDGGFGGALGGLTHGTQDAFSA